MPSKQKTGPVQCFYCSDHVSLSRAERDHFPMPRRHGGVDVVWACKDCHNLKDRHRLIPEAYEAASNRMSEDLVLQSFFTSTVLAMTGTDASGAPRNDGVPKHWPWDNSPAELWEQISGRLQGRMERILWARTLAGRESPAWDHYLEQQKWTEPPCWW